MSNYYGYRKIEKDEDTTYIVYVHGSNTPSLVRDLEELELLQDVLRLNSSVKIVSINHHKNDLDGFYNDSLPFIFIATRLGTIELY